jgi:LPS-assembly lipoprotein
MMAGMRGLRFGWLALALLLSACGFQLRGNVVLPPVLQATLLEGDRFSLLVSELDTVLRNAGAHMVDSRSQATAVLKVLDETSSQRVLSIGVAGRAAEYEIRHLVEYRLEDARGEVLVEKQTLSARRNFQFDENDVLGKANEEQSLTEEMQRDLALRIVQQLSIVAR